MWDMICLHKDIPCGFSTFFCITMVSHVTAYEVLVTRLKGILRQCGTCTNPHHSWRQAFLFTVRHLRKFLKEVLQHFLGICSNILWRFFRNSLGSHVTMVRQTASSSAKLLPDILYKELWHTRGWNCKPRILSINSSGGPSYCIPVWSCNAHRV